MIKRKHTVMFVDDDPLVLNGLRRSVEEYNEFWSVDFALSAGEALDKLAEIPFDVVITDMHMPSMDGNQLLDVVSREYPGVIRFVLSGNTSDNQSMKSTRLVHQMIPKPSEMEHIYTIVERSCRLRDMLTDPHLLRIITGIKTLPSVPLLYHRLLKELQSGTASSQSIGNIIAQDTAMTAKILQLVNSSFFGLADNISSPQRAVTILGLNTIKALVMGIHVFSEYQGRSNLPISIDYLWKHSMLVSSLAYSIARSINLNKEEQENARVSGILHDIGKLMLFKIPDFFQKVQLNKNGLISVESEYKVLGTSHAEMGAYLMGIWGLPNPIVEAITFHHRPGVQISKKADLMTALYVANGLANMWQIEKDINYNAYLDMNYLEKVGVVDRLDEWTYLVRELIKIAN
ncbi:MAG: response regulator [Chloroflexota bacterium]